MSDSKSKQEYIDMYEDAVAALIVSKHAEIQGEELKELAREAREDPTCAPSEAQRRWFWKLINKMERRRNWSEMLQTLKPVLKVAVIMIAIVSLAFVIPFATVEAFRMRVINFFLENHEEYTQVFPDVTEESQAGLPTYIPEGFTLAYIEETGESNLIVQYKDGENVLMYIRGSVNTGMQLDTENAENAEAININNTQALFVQKDGVFSLSWYDEQYSYMLMGQIEKDELIKMAESVK